MHGFEAIQRGQDAPRPRVRLAVAAGAAGEERARRIFQRVQSTVGRTLDLEPRALSSTADPEDPSALIAALVAGDADFAACSADHLPVELPAGIRLEGAMRTSDPLYRLISAAPYTGIDGLPDGARVAACDPSARAQLLFRRPSLQVQLASPARTLIAGVSHGVWDAAIVPFPSGDLPSLTLRIVPSAQIMPPSGRGVIALLATDDADPAAPWRRMLNEPDAEDCLLCERAFLLRMASCATGLSIARAERIGGRLELGGIFADPDGTWLVSARASGPPSFGRILGLEVAESCRELSSARRSPAPAARPGGSPA